MPFQPIGLYKCSLVPSLAQEPVSFSNILREVSSSAGSVEESVELEQVVVGSTT